MKTRLQKLAAFAAAATLAAGSFAAPASAAYPDHAIRLIVPYAAGGSSDIVGREIAVHLGKALGQPIVVENVGGAGGSLGVTKAAQAQPDGYTLFLGANSEMLINKLLQPKLDYDAIRDFRPIGLIGTGSIVIIGKKTLPAATLADVLELARKQNGLNYGTSGVGTIQHLVGERIKIRAKVPLTHVAYRGAGPLMNDVLGGQIDLGIATLASAKTYIDSGMIKAFAVSADQRSPFGPNIPAIAEFPGLSDFTLETWYGVFGPAKLPADVAATLERALSSVLDKPELVANLAKQAIGVSKKSAAEMGPFMAKENEKFRNVISQGNITID